ncbi:MAG: hypothetical protein AB1744_02565, partial [Candidatus Zixiibacteriota bacterium]
MKAKVKMILITGGPTTGLSHKPVIGEAIVDRRKGCIRNLRVGAGLVSRLSQKLLLSTMIIERSRDQVRYLIVAAELVSAGRTGWDKPTP